MQASWDGVSGSLSSRVGSALGNVVPPLFFLFDRACKFSHQKPARVMRSWQRVRKCLRARISQIQSASKSLTWRSPMAQASGPRPFGIRATESLVIHRCQNTLLTVLTCGPVCYMVAPQDPPCRAEVRRMRRSDDAMLAVTMQVDTTNVCCRGEALDACTKPKLLEPSCTLPPSSPQTFPTSSSQTPSRFSFPPSPSPKHPFPHPRTPVKESNGTLGNKTMIVEPGRPLEESALDQELHNIVWSQCRQTHVESAGQHSPGDVGGWLPALNSLVG